MRRSEQLQEPDAPRFQPGQLYSMLDLVAGATITCDRCRRWQRLPILMESEGHDAARKLGWSCEGEDLCPLCAHNAHPAENS